jgi:hypothetical protein
MGCSICSKNSALLRLFEDSSVRDCIKQGFKASGSHSHAYFSFSIFPPFFRFSSLFDAEKVHGHCPITRMAGHTR